MEYLVNNIMWFYLFQVECIYYSFCSVGVCFSKQHST